MVKRAKRQLEKWMNQRCDIYGWEEEENEAGIVTRKQVLWMEQVPCRFSYGSLQKAAKEEDFLLPGGTVVLFTPAEVILPVGAVVRMDQRQYRLSGESRRYATHTETVLVPFGEEKK